MKMARKLFFVVVLLFYCVLYVTGTKPYSKLELDEDVEVFGDEGEEMMKAKNKNAEQILLRQEFLSSHQQQPNVEVFDNSNSQSDNLRNGRADGVSIIINNVKAVKENENIRDTLSNNDPDIPVVKGYKGLSEAEVKAYLKPTTEAPKVYVPTKNPYEFRSNKGFANPHAFVPYQGPNIQYSSNPYIECRPIAAPYYSYNVGSMPQGLPQQKLEWNNQLTSFGNTNNGNCDCSGTNRKAYSFTSSYTPSLVYSRPYQAQVKPKVVVDGKLAKPFKPPSK